MVNFLPLRFAVLWRVAVLFFFFRRICVPTTLLGRHAEIFRAARRLPVGKLTCTLAEEFVVGPLL